MKPAQQDEMPTELPIEPAFSSLSIPSDDYVRWRDYGIALRAHCERLVEENRFLHTCGIIELAVRNVNVKSYIDEWEGRALKSESRLAALREIADAAIEFESYLSKVNTQERQSIVFQCPDDDIDGLAVAGFCERLSRLGQAIRALKDGSGG